MSDFTNPHNMLDVAMTAHHAGLCVLPPKEDGSKRPIKAWQQYIQTPSTTDEISNWYATDRHGIGIVLGKTSGNLECIDFDDKQAYRNFLDLAEAAGMIDVVNRIEAGFQEETPNGIHWLYRCHEIDGNTKLARRPIPESETTNNGETIRVLIETRGEGGYAIVSPSHGPIHPSGRTYTLQQGGFDSITTITPDERKALWNLARSMDEMPRSESVPSLTTDSTTERPGDWFNRTKTWHEVLEPHGWTHVFDHNNESFWRRPGKEQGHSATTGYNGLDILKVFSSSTPFDAEKSYSKFATHSVLNFGGDWAAAARSIRIDMPSETSAVVNCDPIQSLAETGWSPVDLSDAISGDSSQRNQPTMLSRSDGTLLLYPARIHEIKGAPESGKGWLALIACRQELRAGNAVVYIDLEDHPDGIVERLKALGINDDVIKSRFHYVHPDGPLNKDTAGLFFSWIESKQPTLVVLDSVAEAMEINSLDPISNTDAASFSNLLPKPLSKLGVTVLLIDHVTKADGGKNRYSVGAQHKLAAVSGASYVVSIERTFGRGRKGVASITVVKDRPGFVRRHADGSDVIAKLAIHANDEGSYVDATLEPPASQTIEGTFGNDALKHRISAYIAAAAPHTPTLNEIRENVTGGNDAITVAWHQLEADGFISVDKTGKYKFWSIKPFQAAA